MHELGFRPLAADTQLNCASCSMKGFGADNGPGKKEEACGPCEI